MGICIKKFPLRDPSGVRTDPSSVAKAMGEKVPAIAPLLLTPRFLIKRDRLASAKTATLFIPMKSQKLVDEFVKKADYDGLEIAPFTESPKKAPPPTCCCRQLRRNLKTLFSL
jgi:hypothetical protein